MWGLLKVYVGFFVSGLLIMSSSCKIGGVVRISRYFNTWLWSGFHASWSVWLWVLLDFSTTWRWRILQGRSLWSLRIWCLRAGTDFNSLLLCFCWLKCLQSVLFVLLEFDSSRNMINVTRKRVFWFLSRNLKEIKLFESPPKSKKFSQQTCMLTGLSFGFWKKNCVKRKPNYFLRYWWKSESSFRYGMAFLVFSVSNLVLTLFASVITALICPQAAGSGIPEVKAYLNGVDAPGILSPRTLLVKVKQFLVHFFLSFRNLNLD